MNGLAVLVPAYRNQAGLDRSLRSLQNTNSAFDVVIVDDGSPRPISAPERLRDDVPVSLLRLDSNQGIAAALNHGLRYILRGPYSYVGRLDTGDTVVRERFARQLAFLDARPTCAAVSSFVDFVNPDQRLLFRYRPPCDHVEILRVLHLNNCLVHSGTTMRISVLKEIGLYSENAPCVEDYELFLRMARHHQLAVMPEVLTHCEYSANGLSVLGRRRQQRERLKLQIRYFDLRSPYSFYGLIRTLLAMPIPHSAVFRFKRAYFH